MNFNQINLKLSLKTKINTILTNKMPKLLKTNNI